MLWNYAQMAGNWQQPRRKAPLSEYLTLLPLSASKNSEEEASMQQYTLLPLISTPSGWPAAATAALFISSA